MNTSIAALEALDWQTKFLIWYAVGLVLSIFWPLRYWSGMKGSWKSFFKGWPFVALFGPFAIIAGFPL